MPSPRVSRLVAAASIGLLVSIWAVFVRWGGDPVDALCYWLTDPAAPYHPEPFQFVYSPAIAQAMSPALALPFDWFTALLRGIGLAALYGLAGPLSVVAVFLPPVAAELNAGNINLLLGLLIVLGFRRPALWCLPLLTKPTLGVGLVWFAVRGEWRSLAIALGTTAAIVAASFALAPTLWFDYVGFLATGTAHVAGWPFPIPIWARLPVALLLVIWGARTDRKWTVVVAATIALPRLYFQSPALLLAIMPLVGWRTLATSIWAGARSAWSRAVPGLHIPSRLSTPRLSGRLASRHGVRLG